MESLFTDLAQGADGDIEIKMTAEAVILVIALLIWGAVKIYDRYQTRKKNGRAETYKSPHALAEEKLLSDNLATLKVIEGHMKTQAIHMENLVKEQRGTTDAIKELEKEVAVTNAMMGAKT